jgi:hypothetical protein
VKTASDTRSLNKVKKEMALPESLVPSERSQSGSGGASYCLGLPKVKRPERDLACTAQS